jgi:hypothetical protein
MSTRSGFSKIQHLAMRRCSASAGAVAAAGALLGFSLAGCVSTNDGHGARLTDNLEIYAPFDNERDWGPSFLVGPPQHYLGEETRIDDTRAVAHGTAADPSAPPSAPAPPSGPTPP